VESLQAERGDMKRRVDEFEGEAGALAELPAVRVALREPRQQVAAFSLMINLINGNY